MKKSILAILATVAAISASAATVKDLSDKEVLTIDANTTWYGTTGQSPINVPSGRTAVINIKKGVTFTVYGADADGTACAVPAIYVPPTATLYITGEGKLVAVGGNGGNGGNGSSGADGRYVQSAYHFNGEGGNGGYGGGGAGAGIGGNGGTGASGGTGEAEEKLLDKLGIERTDLLCGNIQRAVKSAAPRQVQRGKDQRFIHWNGHAAVTRDPLFVAECLSKCLAKRDADILHGVVVIHLRVTVAGNGKVKTAVRGKEREHMIQKAAAACDFALALSVQI